MAQTEACWEDARTIHFPQTAIQRISTRARGTKSAVLDQLINSLYLKEIYRNI